jgi:hypothetical protein
MRSSSDSKNGWGESLLPDALLPDASGRDNPPEDLLKNDRGPVDLLFGPDFDMAAPFERNPEDAPDRAARPSKKASP